MLYIGGGGEEEDTAWTTALPPAIRVKVRLNSQGEILEAGGLALKRSKSLQVLDGQG